MFPSLLYSTKIDLIGRLLIHYKASDSPAPPKPAPAKRGRPSKASKATTDTPPVPQSKQRKSLDAKTIQAAMRTPLPTSPDAKFVTPRSRPTVEATRIESRRSSRTAGIRRNARTIAIFTAIFAALLAAAMQYCATNSCPAHVDNAFNTARDTTAAAIDKSTAWAESTAFAAGEFGRKTKTQVAEVVVDLKNKLSSLSG